jgi:mannosylfructose-6-phosphate phosphatase
MGRTMERWGLRKIRLFSSDLDGTLLGNAAATTRFRVLWECLDPKDRPLLVYNSGRLLDDMADLLPGSGLPRADVLIGGVGTMLKADIAIGLDEEFRSFLGPQFDDARLERVLRDVAGIEKQPARFQHAFKSSWYLHGASPAALKALEARLDTAGFNVKLIYSSDRDLDVLPRGADKGAALSWLCSRLRIDLDEVVVAGDTGNDASMFTLPGARGIVVANGRAELGGLVPESKLYFHAQAAMADGVIEGLAHWGAFKASFPSNREGERPRSSNTSESCLP